MIGKDEGLLDWEIRFYKNFFVGSVSLILILVMVLSYWCLKIRPQQQGKPITSGTFYMKFGGAMCGHNYITQCGVHLVKCDNGKEYHCMHEVSIELDKTQ